MSDSDMFVVSLIGQKGGSGKTTLSLNLAVAAARSGLSACILDLDPQANAANWRDRRAGDNPAVVSAPPSRLRQTLDAARSNGARFCLIDTPGKSDSAAIAAASAANVVLIPVNPQMFHLETLPGVLQLLRVASPVPPAWVVLNDIHPLAKSQAATLKTVISKNYGIPVCPVHLSHLEIYGSSADAGETPLETDPKGRAAGEVRALWKFTLSQLIKTLKTERKNGENQ
jgi:chromosome partitioning protein